MPMAHLEPPSEFRGIFRTDDDARAVYAEAAGIARIEPVAVAVPADANDATTLVRWAHETRTPLVARGSGSSMGGGAIGRGVVVDLSRLTDIGDIDVTRRTIRIGPGAVRGEVERQARRHGLRFPVDPSSGAFCTMGGMAATNASGAHTLGFGPTRRWVRALDCVFEDGSRAEIRRGSPPPRGIPAIERFLRDVHPTLTADAERESAWHEGVRKDSSGYAVGEYARSRELVDLLVGSEGTLALFVGIELDLIPVEGATSSVLGAFGSLEAAVTAAVRAREAGAVACELLEKTFLDVAASGGHGLPVPDGTEAVLLAEAEGADAESAASAARAIERVFLDSGASTVRLALDAVTEAELWEFRHAASPILARLDPSLKSMQFVEDGAVPPDRLPAYVRGVREALARQQLRGVIFGHAGDAHVHVNPLVDVRLPDWRERVARLLADVVSLTGSLGGTLTGEHGDGRLRTPLLDQVWSDRARERFALLKHAFDPLDILNPGVKVPLPGQRSVEDIKYDPSLPRLPEAAARALGTVERERAYARFRLELLREAGSGKGEA